MNETLVGARKKLAVCGLIILLVGMAGCGGDGDDQSPPPNNNVQAAPPPPNDPPRFVLTLEAGQIQAIGAASGQSVSVAGATSISGPEITVTP